MSWTIRGESGKALDATPRTFEVLAISGCRVEFATLAADKLVWTATIADATGTGTIVPDIGQVVELYWNSTRKFRGWVTRPRVAMRRITIEAQGPWWWMERTPLTETQTDPTGAAAERSSYVFPTGDHATKLSSLISRAIALDVPMQSSAIASAYSTPQMTLAEMTVSSALAELMGWLPDAVAMFDHSTTGGTGEPTLRIVRRGAMTPLELAIGTDPVELGEINPRLDLEVSRVEIKSVTRQAATGLPQWADQSSGTAAPGKRQIITVSGPEVTALLPPDSFERIPIYAASTTAATILQFLSPTLQKLLADHPTTAIKTAVLTDPYTGVNKAKLTSFRTEFEEAVSSGTYTSLETAIPSGKTAIMLGLDGQTPAPEWMLRSQVVTKAWINDYWITDGNGTTSTPPFLPARRMQIVSALAPDVLMLSSTDPAGGNGTPIYAYLIKQQRSDALPIWLIDTANLPATVHTGTARSSSDATQIQLATDASDVDGFYVGQPILWTRAGIRYGAFISAYAGSTRIATLKSPQPSDKAPANGQTYLIPGSFVSPADYDYLSPPAGLAAGLAAAQNWVPWEGPITIVGDQASGDNLLDRSLNLTGTLAPCATMAALQRRTTHELLTGRTTIELGAPARADFGTLANRVRRQPRDNIVLL
jgi:hypothetical protein